MNISNLMQILQGNSGNPMAKNLIQMIMRRDSKGVEQMARNVCKEKGIDADKAFSQMQNKYK